MTKPSFVIVIEILQGRWAEWFSIIGYNILKETKTWEYILRQEIHYYLIIDIP